MFLIKTVLGPKVVVTADALVECFLEGDFRVLDMSLSVILDLRAEYLKRGGPLPITSESIRETFNR